MACANCEALRERVRELEREQGLLIKRGELDVLRGELRITQGQARILLHLHLAKRRVTTEELVARNTASSANTVCVQLCKAHHRIGQKLWESWSGPGASGYRMTPEGHARMAAALSSAGLQP